MKKLWSAIAILLGLSIYLGVSVAERDPLIRNLLLFVAPVVILALGIAIAWFLRGKEANDEAKPDSPPAARRKPGRGRRR
jgi:membrane protein DedA with SNARE-associated domain